MLVIKYLRLRFIYFQADNYTNCPNNNIEDQKESFNEKDKKWATIIKESLGNETVT